MDSAAAGLASMTGRFGACDDSRISNPSSDDPLDQIVDGWQMVELQEQEPTSGLSGVGMGKILHTFSKQQHCELEKEYLYNAYATRHKRHKLSGKLQLTEHQVEMWFQHRRLVQFRGEGGCIKALLEGGEAVVEVGGVDRIVPLPPLDHADEGGVEDGDVAQPQSEKYHPVAVDARGQTIELEKEYFYNAYVTKHKQQELSEKLQLTENQVEMWFADRRAIQSSMA